MISFASWSISNESVLRLLRTSSSICNTGRKNHEKYKKG
jgi:hypothetical protein